MGNPDDDWVSDDEPLIGHMPTSPGPSQTFKRNNVDPSAASRVIQIGSNDVGKLIGRGGSSIKELRARSGCRIDVGDESALDRKAVDVEISGKSDEEVAKAAAMVEQHLGYNNAFYGDKVDDEVIDWGAINEQHEKAQKARWAACPPLIKAFYREHPETTAMTEAEASKFRSENNDIVVSNFNPETAQGEILKPVAEFHHAFHNFPEIMATIRKQKFGRPSPIQAQAWPYLLSGKDLIGIAQTGTGKTLAFLLPAFIHIDEQPVPRNERGGPNVLVLCPTRELALQIAGEVEKYEYKGVRSVCVYGGGDRKKQMKVVTDGVQIIIATPGRLNDLVEAKCIKVESITYLVLDEADKMLDMGFEPQIRKVMLDIRPDRQTVMTSATWPAGVRRLASSYMDDPVTVFIGSLDLAAVHSVSQQIIMIDNGEEEKRDILMDFFSKMDDTDKVMVFVGKKTRADDISSDLSLAGIDCQCIHGDREQSDREQALMDLKTGEVRILIATDVASRGIDITDITHVINFDFPRNIEEYVHRVGRTGRAGRTGVSITLMERRDRKQAEELIKILQEAGQEVPEELEELAEKYKKWKIRDEEERRRYGRSRGPGGGDGCFKCGEFGHISRDCPQGGGRRGRGGCFNCGEQGHEKRSCPKMPSSGRGRGGSRW